MAESQAASPSIEKVIVSLIVSSEVAVLMPIRYFAFWATWENYKTEVNTVANNGYSP